MQTARERKKSMGGVRSLIKILMEYFLRKFTCEAQRSELNELLQSPWRPFLPLHISNVVDK